MHCRKRKKNSYRNILHQLKKISKISKISKTELHLENNVRKMWNFVMFFKNRTFFVSIDIIATFWCFKPIPLLLSKRKVWTFEMTKSVLSGRRDRKTRDLSVNKWGRGARLGDSVREILLNWTAHIFHF